MSRTRPGPARAFSVSHDLAQPLPDEPQLEGAIVIHCAAEIRADGWRQHWASNVIGTRNLLQWAERHQAPRFILISTGGVYGYAPGRRMRETDHARPKGWYGRTKYVSELLCRRSAECGDFELVIFRLYFPFSPARTTGIFRMVSEAIKDGSQLQIRSGGGPRITPVHISDAIDAVVRSTCANFPAGCYNLCADDDISFFEIVQSEEARQGLSANVIHTSETASDMMGDNAALRRTGWRATVPAKRMLV
jgi:nucleoside-diphosphate-sugar epimerase